MKKTWENGKKPKFGSNIGPFGQNLGPKKFLIDFTSTSSYILSKYHPTQFKGNPMTRTWINCKKSIFGFNFGLFDPNFGHPEFFINFGSTSAHILF